MRCRVGHQGCIPCPESLYQRREDSRHQAMLCASLQLRPCALQHGEYPHMFPHELYILAVSRSNALLSLLLPLPDARSPVMCPPALLGMSGLADSKVWQSNPCITQSTQHEKRCKRKGFTKASSSPIPVTLQVLSMKVDVQYC